MNEMKDSGIEWIGKIPNDWRIIRNKNAFVCSKELVGEKSELTQLLSLTTCGVKKKDINNATGKLPESFDTYQFVKENDIVMCLFDLDCSAVFSGISSFDGMISPAYRVLSCNECMEPGYADYWFRYISDGRKFNHYAKNIRYTLSYEEFSVLPLLLPKKSEQRRIFDYLDRKCSQIDSIIAKQQEVIEKLKEYKLSVITEAVTKGLNPDVPMKDSGIEWIGKIPEHWNIIKLARIINSTQNGLTRRNLDKSDGQIVLKLKNISANGEISYEYQNRIELTEKELNTYSLSDGDFLFVRVNGSKSLVGKCAVFHSIGETVAYNDHIIRVKISNYCIERFLLYYLLSSSGKTEIDLHTSTAAGQYTISGEGLRDVYLTLPLKDEQKQIVNYLDNKCEQIDFTITKKQKLIEKLTDYKKSLVYEVVTGKKEV